MKFILDVLRGIVIGVANIIPGVSGGTMMVTMGIYDKLLSAITGIVKHFFKSLKTLFPYLLGMAVGICAFAFILTKYLLVKFPLPTGFAFIGLILGGVPVLFAKVRKGKKSGNQFLKLFVFAIFFALIIGMQFLGAGSDRVVEPSVLTTLIMLAMGVIAAAAMVIPGVSGSLILLAFGYYNPVTGAITEFLSGLKSFDLQVMWHEALILVPFGIGVLLGIFFVAKLIEWLLRHYETITYCGILGLVTASPVPVFFNALGGKITVLAVAASVLTFAAGFYTAARMGKSK